MVLGRRSRVSVTEPNSHPRKSSHAWDLYVNLLDAANHYATLTRRHAGAQVDSRHQLQ
jgi:hypothetical protein